RGGQYVDQDTIIERFAEPRVASALRRMVDPQNGLTHKILADAMGYDGNAMADIDQLAQALVRDGIDTQNLRSIVSTAENTILPNLGRTPVERATAIANIDAFRRARIDGILRRAGIYPGGPNANAPQALRILLDGTYHLRPGPLNDPN